MANINIAFSSGLESVAMLFKALNEGHRANLCILNVANNRQTFMFEFANAMRLVKYIEESEDYKRLPGKVGEIFTAPRCPWAPPSGRTDWMESVALSTVTQQFAVILGMLDLRRLNLLKHYPAVWIGWLHQDTAEYSGIEYDFSEDDYAQFLHLPTKIGRLSSGDRTGTPYRAPLWNLTKKEVYEMVPKDLMPFVLHTGSAFIEGDEIIYNAYPHKRREWASAGIEAEMAQTWSSKLADIPAHYRMLAGALFASDFDLPPEADQLVAAIAEDRACMILSGDVSTLRYLLREIGDQVVNVIELVNKHSLTVPSKGQEPDDVNEIGDSID